MWLDHFDNNCVSEESLRPQEQNGQKQKVEKTRPVETNGIETFLEVRNICIKDTCTEFQII